MFTNIPSTVTRNCFFTLTCSFFATDNQRQISLDVKNAGDIYKVLYSEKNTNDALVDLYSNGRGEDTLKPNVIYIVLESVGALNILKNGTLVQELTPVLFSLKENAILFPALSDSQHSTWRQSVAIICLCCNLARTVSDQFLTVKYVQAASQSHESRRSAVVPSQADATASLQLKASCS